MQRLWCNFLYSVRLAQTRCKYKNCAKIKSELSTMHMTFTSPERFWDASKVFLSFSFWGALPPDLPAGALLLHPRWEHSPQTPYTGAGSTPSVASPLPSIPRSATAEYHLNISTHQTVAADDSWVSFVVLPVYAASIHMQRPQWCDTIVLNSAAKTFYIVLACDPPSLFTLSTVGSSRPPPSFGGHTWMVHCWWNCQTGNSA